MRGDDVHGVQRGGQWLRVRGERYEQENEEHETVFSTVVGEGEFF
jgi:hypothetical protein